MKEQEGRPSITAESLEERKLIRKAERRSLVPVSWVQYQAGWEAYREKPTVGVVANAAGVRRSIAAHLIEEGYPEAEMEPYGERIAKVRKISREIEDYNIARAQAEYLQVFRGIKIQLRKAIGPNWENLSFDPKSLSNMTPRQGLELMKFLGELSKLETVALNEGKDETVVRIEHHANTGSPTESSGKLAMLMQKISGMAERSSFVRPEDDVIDADFVDSVMEPTEEEFSEPSEESFVEQEAFEGVENDLSE